MELRTLKLKIERSENNEEVNFVIPDLDNIKIKMTDSNVNDIEKLFNLIFDKIIKDKKIIKFELEDNNNDLFYEVAKEIVEQLNSEIKSSESDFNKIIELDDFDKNSC